MDVDCKLAILTFDQYCLLLYVPFFLHFVYFHLSKVKVRVTLGFSRRVLYMSMSRYNL
jgi:hypothetical protein